MRRGNARTKPTTTEALIRRAAFVAGHREVLTGQPFNPDAFMKSGKDGRKEQWSYERGRCFGHIFKDKLKDGNRVRREAISAFRDAYRRGDII